MICKMKISPSERQPMVPCGRVMVRVGSTTRKRLEIWHCPHCDRGVKK